MIRDKAYLIWLRCQPCLFTGLRAHDGESVVAAHIGTAGKGLKSNDCHAIPVMDHIHKDMHQRGEVTVFREMAPDWLLRKAMQAYARECWMEWKEGK